LETVVAAGGVPQSLVGTWGKSIALTTFEKSHVVGEPAGHYGIKIRTSGLTSLYYGTSPFTTMRAVVSGHSVTFGPRADGVCPGKGIYHWVISRSRLDFTAVKEGCGARKVLMTAGTFALEH